jgi:hypothetical protein
MSAAFSITRDFTQALFAFFGSRVGSWLFVGFFYEEIHPFHDEEKDSRGYKQK